MVKFLSVLLQMCYVPFSWHVICYINIRNFAIHEEVLYELSKDNF